jgi:hypothetical protein
MYYRGSAAAVIVYDITKQVRMSPASDTLLGDRPRNTEADWCFVILASALGASAMWQARKLKATHPVSLTKPP